MRPTIFLLVLLALSTTAYGQKSNDVITRQIKTSGSASNITLTYDQNSNVSKIMAVADNFRSGEASRSGLMAMNFAAGFFYAGTSLAKAPDEILLTFWVMARKPRFAEANALRVHVGDKVIDLGSPRYAAKARENMEYLNFKLTREQLSAIASGSNARIDLGSESFTFTDSQLKMLSSLSRLSEPLIVN